MAKKAPSRKTLSNRASRIRKDMREGKPVSQKDTDFLADWDAQKKPVGAKPKGDPPPDEPKLKREDTPDVPPPGPAAPPPKRPPKVNDSTGKSRTSWRAKYGAATTGGSREQTCQTVAALFCSALRRANAYISGAGGTPIFDDGSIKDTIYPAAVLTADDFLPKDLDAGPHVTVVAAAAMTLGQAAVTRYRANKVLEKTISVIEPEDELAARRRASDRPPDVTPPQDKPAAELKRERAQAKTSHNSTASDIGDDTP